MSKTKLAGLLVFGVGAVLGIYIGGQAGLGVVAVALVIGFGLWFSSEARGISGPSVAPKPRILVLLKEVHARPQRNGRFQEIKEPNEPGLEFEVFVNCWLLNESDFAIGIADKVELSLKPADGSISLGKRIAGDLESWRLGSLVRDEWDAEIIHPRQEQIIELSTEKPLECGLPRQGWLHFRFEGLSPAALKNGELRLSIQDSFSNTHSGLATGPVRHLPGRIWPFVAQGASASQSAS
jgi:hypothetical protein